VQPDSSVTVVLFIAIFSAIVSTPIALAVEWLIGHVLCAPSLEDEAAAAQQDEATLRELAQRSRQRDSGRRHASLTIGGHASVSQTSKQSQVAGEASRLLNELCLQLKLYHQSLTEASDRAELEAAWGLDAQGNFLRAGSSGSGTDGGARGEWCGWLPSVGWKRAEAVSTLDLLHRELVELEWEVAAEKAQLAVTPAMSATGEKALEGASAASVSRWVSAASKSAQSRRLLYLFQKDLLPGVKGQILENKRHRGEVGAGRAMSRRAKTLAWAVLGALDLGMLFYVFLFAVSQDSVRQRAWAQSFALWLVLEIALVSSSVVFFMHVLLPLVVLSDVRKIQQKMLRNVKDYYRDLYVQQQRQRRSFAYRPVTEGDDGGEGDATAAALKAPSAETFNAARFLFVSHRMAALLPTSAVAQMVLHFHTTWPKQSYRHVSSVAKSYTNRFSSLTRSLSLVVMYFATNFIVLPLSLQDCLVQVANVFVLGYTVLLHVQLYQIYPVLVVVPLLLVAAIVHFLVQSSQTMEQVRRRQLMAELTADLPADVGADGALAEAPPRGTAKAAPEEPTASAAPAVRDASAAVDVPHVSRRESVRQALAVYKAMSRVPQLTGLSEGSEDGSDNGGSDDFDFLEIVREELLGGDEDDNDNDNNSDEEPAEEAKRDAGGSRPHAVLAPTPLRPSRIVVDARAASSLSSATGSSSPAAVDSDAFLSHGAGVAPAPAASPLSRREPLVSLPSDTVSELQPPDDASWSWTSSSGEPGPSFAPPALSPRDSPSPSGSRRSRSTSEQRSSPATVSSHSFSSLWSSSASSASGGSLPSDSLRSSSEAHRSELRPAEPAARGA
jgi:hypothetical protein